MPDLILLLKALEAGERWITIHPNGPDEKGQPVLIKPQPDGSMKVIGGAGGALNHLKLTGVKSEDTYKNEAKQRAQSRREEMKRRAASDREHGLAESKGRAREALKAQLGDQRVKLVQEVAQALGWNEEDLRFPEEKFGNVSAPARKKAEKQHAAELLGRVREAVEFQRQRQINDAELRVRSGLGEVPLNAPPEALSVQDISPVEPETKGFGYQTDYGKRAAAAGATEDMVKQEAAAIRAPVEPAKAEKKQERKDFAARIEAELELVREPEPKLPTKVMIEAKQSVQVLKAAKAFAMASADVRKKQKQIETSAVPVEPTAYIIETGKPVDSDLVKDLDNDLRTIRTRSFLNKVGSESDVGRSVGVGAYNSINALALAAGGASLVDRSVVDVMGIAGAAQVLARRLRRDLTDPEMEHINEAMATFHSDRYMSLSEEALKQAAEWHEMAAEIDLGAASSTSDLQVAQELNAKRRDFAVKASTVLGTALGEMEANAALVVALKQKPKKTIQVSLGKTTIENAILQVRALGLDKGDYEVTEAGSSRILTVTDAGIDKLAAPVSREDLATVRESLAIMNGLRDEENWLPEGVSKRPDLAMNPKPGVAPRLAKPFKVSAGNVASAISDYIGGRTADGDAPADIMAGLLSEDIMRDVDRPAFMDALNQIAPIYGEGGKMVRAESHAEAFNKLADDFVERTYGADRTPLQRQTFSIDHTSMDALHRALTRNPEGVAAFKPVGELTGQDELALRKRFTADFARSDPKAEALRKTLERMDKEEPAKEAEGLFGSGPNPEHAIWKKERDEAAEAYNAASLTWEKYVKTLGSPQAAYAAISDVVKSDVIKDFAEVHNSLTKTPLKLGRQVIQNDLNHLDAIDPEARERRLETQRRLLDSLRTRVAGRYASGSVKDQEAAAREAEAAADQAQMGLFGQADEPEEKQRPLDAGERHSIGHAAERQIAGMMSVVGPNFRPGVQTKVFSPTMSGKYAMRQRAVKLVEHNKHTMLGLGVGSGKTAIMLSSFTDLKSKGKVSKGIFAVPSVVQGEFHGQALQILEPGKFRWHADPGASREARLKAYQDPQNDFTVVTHQAMREDFDHLAEQHDGMTSAAFDALSPAERKNYAKTIADKHGWNLGFLAVDEGHNLLNRKGKQNSHLANVMDALSANTEYYVNSTADPVKNDASEAFDILAKMDPERYTDRDAFTRKYGVDTAASKAGLQREMARHFYTGAVDPGVAAHRQVHSVSVTPQAGQHDQIGAVDKAATAARLAKMSGGVDVEAMRTLAPAAFADVPQAQWEAVARKLNPALGMLHETALQHAINDGAKTAALSKIAGERKGKPGVVFIHRLERVKEVSERLAAEGHRVVTLTGSDSSAEKDRKKQAYKNGEYDILVASDAGAVGANLQTGKWLVQYDTPQTAMLHAQRNGRIHRIGQTEDVELIDLVANHPAEKRARERLEKKYGLRDIMSSPLDGLDEHGLAGYLMQARAGHLSPAPLPDAVPGLDMEPQEKPGDQMELAA